jgi:hypothetical protein
MKKNIQLYLIILLVALTGCAGKTQKGNNNTVSTSSDTGKAILTFREYEHQFGKVDEGEKVAYIFTFENTGTSDLVILSATTTCGCTVPEYDRKPVSPGETGKLEVIFDTSGRNGVQSKVITVRSNASNHIVLLKITAEVINNNNN